MLIFVIFVTIPRVTKFSTHEFSAVAAELRELGRAQPAQDCAHPRDLRKAVAQ